MGLKTVPYWLGTFCFDFCMYLIGTVFFIILCFAFDISGVTGNLGNLILNMLFFGICFIWQNYALSFLFKTGNQAQKLIILINYVFYYVVPSVPVMFIK